MVKVNIHEAKTHLSRLVEKAEGGREVTIARAGKPVARLVPFKKKEVPRKKGLLKGKIWIGQDFDEPLPQEILDAFEGKAAK